MSASTIATEESPRRAHPPLSSASRKRKTERVEKNMVGTSTSIRGTWVRRYGMPSRSRPPKNPTSRLKSRCPMRNVSTAVRENMIVVAAWTHTRLSPKNLNRRP
jgi:hypothetical protein